MFNLKRTAVFFAILSFFISCKKENAEHIVITEEVYAYDDGTGLSSKCFVFKKTGVLFEYQSSSPLTFVDNCYWACNGSEFVQSSSKGYSINYLPLLNKHFLYVDNKFAGEIDMAKYYININGRKYPIVKSFNSACYSSVLVSPSSLTVPLSRSSQQVSVTVNNPIAAGVIGVKSSLGWVTNLRMENGKVKFIVEQSTTSRSGSIEVTYTNAKSCSLMIYQNN